MTSTPALETDVTTASPDHSLRLVKVVFGLSTIAVFTKIFGFSEKCVIAHFFGTGDTADVYFATTSIVLSLIWLVRELVNPSLLPVFAACLGAPGPKAGFLFKKVFLSAAGALALAAVLIALFARPLTRVLTPGFAGAKGQMTYRLLRLLAPTVLFLGLTMVAYTVLNAHRKFVRAAWPEAALKLFVVLGLIVLLPVLGIHALALVMGLGGLACLLIQLSFIPERHFLYRPNTHHEGAAALRKVGLLMTPLVLGVLFSHVNSLVDNVLASTLPTGQLSFLGYSKKLIDALLLIGPVALVTVVYSQLSHLASARDHRSFTRLVRRALRLLVYLTIPTACTLIALSHPIIRLLFQRGHFTTESTAGTAQAFCVYAVGLTAFSLDALLVHSFFAMSDTKTPIKIGILCSLLDVALALALLHPLEHLGIAWAFVIARTVKTILLGLTLNRRCGGIFGTRFLTFAGKLALSTCGLWVALNLLGRVDHSETFLHIVALDLLLPALGAAGVFLLGSHLLRIDEFRAAVALIRHRKAAVKTLYRGP